MYIKESVLVLCALMLVACNPSPAPTDNQSSAMVPTKSVIGITNFESLLSKSRNICDVPCFLGITPGVTLMENVEGILDEYINFLCTNPYPDDMPDNRIRCSVIGYDSRLSISSDRQTGLVTWLFYSPSSKSPVYLENIIALYGVPDSMSIRGLSDEREVYNVYLYYDSLQMKIVLGEVYEIAKTNEVDIMFLEKSDYLSEISSAQDSWEGYRKLP